MLLLLVLLGAVAEVAALIAVAHWIGWGLALLALVAVSASGPFLIRRAGTGVLRHAQAAAARGETLEGDVLDGLVLLAGGVAVCIPGFLGDLVGLALLFGPVRHALERVAGRALLRRLGSEGLLRVTSVRGMGGRRPGGTIVDATTHDATTHDAPGRQPGHGEAGEIGGPRR